MRKEEGLAGMTDEIKLSKSYDLGGKHHFSFSSSDLEERCNELQKELE
jgi:hypothetical protein